MVTKLFYLIQNINVLFIQNLGTNRITIEISIRFHDIQLDAINLIRKTFHINIGLN